MKICSTSFAASLCVFGFLATAPLQGQSLSEAAAKEKERRKKAGTAASTPKPSPAADAKPSPAAPTEYHGESWWRSRARTARDAVADAEAQVKYYEARIEEARTGTRPLPPGDAIHQAPPTRVLTDAEKREAESSLAVAQKQLAAARKQMEELEDQARREQVPPAWLR